MYTNDIPVLLQIVSLYQWSEERLVDILIRIFYFFQIQNISESIYNTEENQLSLISFLKVPSVTSAKYSVNVSYHSLLMSLVPSDCYMLTRRIKQNQL